MRIIDNNAINYVLRRGISLAETYYLTPEIKDEAEIAELIFKKRLPDTIQEISKLQGFREGAYIKNYKDMLNKYKGRSFYNMTGFGDISILAALKTMKDAMPRRLFSLAGEELTVVTEDASLMKKIEREFNQAEKNTTLKVGILGVRGLI